MSGEDNVNNSRLYIALAVLVGVGALVFVTQRARQPQTALDKPSENLPVVAKTDVTRVEIEKPGQAPIVLEKAADTWSVSAPLKAEAAQDAVNAVLDKLAELKVTGVAATRQENQARLEVDAAHGLRVRAKAGDKTLIDLLVGVTKGASTIVREEGKQSALSVKGSIRYVFDKELKDFRKREITDVDVAQLSAIAVRSDKGSFKFERQAGATPEAAETWAQAKGEKPIAKFDPEQAQVLATTATHLRAADFASPGDNDETTGLGSPRANITLTKKDASTVELSIGKQHAASEDYYVRVRGSDVVYRLAKFSAERLMPEAKFFEKADKPAQAAAPQGMPQGMPPGMMGGPGGGGGQNISPEMMKQIQQQLAAQGHGHP